MIPEQPFDWDQSIHREVTEETPGDVPKPLGNCIALMHWFDANSCHDMLSGHSVTSILHLAYQMPIDRHGKKQSTVEMSTCGSEFVAGHTCVEQVMDIWCTLWCLGVPLHEKSHMLGDNKSVVDGSAVPHSRLHK